MARRGAAIGTGQKQNPFKTQHLQHRLQQRSGSAKGVEINQIKAMAIEEGPRQRRCCWRCADLSGEIRLRQIGLQKRTAVGISVIDVKMHRNAAASGGFQPHRTARIPQPAIRSSQRSGSAAWRRCNRASNTERSGPVGTPCERSPSPASERHSLRDSGIPENSGLWSPLLTRLPIGVTRGLAMAWSSLSLACDRTARWSKLAAVAWLRGLQQPLAPHRSTPGRPGLAGVQPRPAGIRSLRPARPSANNAVWGHQVCSFLKQVIQRPAVLVGNSLGGTALTAAVLQPTWVQAVVAAPLPDPALLTPSRGGRPDGRGDGRGNCCGSACACCPWNG